MEHPYSHSLVCRDSLYGCFMVKSFSKDGKILEWLRRKKLKRLELPRNHF